MSVAPQTPQTKTAQAQSVHAERVPRWALPGLLAFFVLLGSIYSVVVPPFETPDEVWHAAFIQHVATGQGLPVAEPDSQALWRQQGTQAPLYYLAAATLTAWVDQTDFPAIYARANPHAAIGRPDAQANINYLSHYPDEVWPWQGSILALHLIRLFSVLLGAVTLWAAYQAVVLIVGPRLALVGTAIFAFVPQFVFISAAASNDNAVNALAALLLWQLVALLTAPSTAQRTAERVASSRLAWIGVTLGLAVLSKLSALALVGIAGLVLLGIAWHKRSWRVIIDAALWVGMPLLVIGGWWYLRNWRLYDDPLAWNVWESNILLRVNPADWRTIVGELGSLFRSFWGLFGWLNVPYPDMVYAFFQALSMLIGIGLLLTIWRQRARLRRLDGQWWAGALLLLWLILLTLSWLRFMRVAPAAQGRYFFPAAPVLIWLAALGVRGWRIWTLEIVIPAALALLCLVTPAWIIAPAYRTPASVATLPDAMMTTDVEAGAELALVGLGKQHLDAVTVLPGETLTVTLAWRALAQPSQDYSVFVHLTDVDGLIVAQADSMPLGGRAPTSMWQPGEIYVDTHRVTIPATAYTPNEAHWAVGLYNAHEAVQPRLPLKAVALSEHVQVVDDAARFGTVTLLTPEGTTPNPLVVDFDDGVTLVGYRFNHRRVAPGDTLAVTLYWQARQPITGDYTIFVHLLDEELQMYGGSDDQPTLPTPTWFVDTVIEDEHTFVVPDSAVPGVYQIELGLYTRPDFDRLPLLEADGAEGADRLLLGPLHVGADQTEGP